ncbi:hypothetical protein B0H11DRAFT_2207987, partial [Mycena galericulata]
MSRSRERTSESASLERNNERGGGGSRGYELACIHTRTRPIRSPRRSRRVRRDSLMARLLGCRRRLALFNSATTTSTSHRRRRTTDYYHCQRMYRTTRCTYICMLPTTLPVVVP